MKPISRRLSSRKIRGIKYEIESCFIEDIDVFQKVGDMIKKDFASGTFDEQEKEDSVDWDIDSPAM